MNETEAFVALNMLPHIGPVRMRKLLEAFGSPVEVLQARGQSLRSVPGVGNEVSESIAAWESKIDLNAEIKRVEDGGVKILTQRDETYPALLREIHDPPIVLYVWGDPEALDTKTIGVVGTRKPSHYANDCAKKLSYQLAYAGLTVASGLARGIDTAAHQAALAAKGRTVAVLGSGLTHLYPPENRELAEKIADNGGAVISEFPMETKADRQTFPMRNRIVSGLSFGLLVVEAGAQSGALISANQAGEQGRSLYVVPGRMDNPGAIGSNKLIQQGAKLVLSAQDILDDFGLLFREKPQLKKASDSLELTENERSVHEAIGDDETAMDDIIAKCGLPTHEVSSTLLALEMRRLVKQLPGSRFLKIQ
jgi:DNA processing protein